MILEQQYLDTPEGAGSPALLPSAGRGCPAPLHWGAGVAFVIHWFSKGRGTGDGLY